MHNLRLVLYVQGNTAGKQHKHMVLIGKAFMGKSLPSLWVAVVFTIISMLHLMYVSWGELFSVIMSLQCLSQYHYAHTNHPHFKTSLLIFDYNYTYDVTIALKHS